jgi:hypothetical protein
MKTILGSANFICSYAKTHRQFKTFREELNLMPCLSTALWGGYQPAMAEIGLLSYWNLSSISLKKKSYPQLEDE